MFTRLDAHGLVNCLENVPPVELRAVLLLQTLHDSADGTLPTVSQDTLASATVELIAYTKACAALLNKLAYLTPIALTNVACAAWPL